MDNTHIVYLKPVGVGGFRGPIRSDTLWAALCWSIRMVFGEAKLEELLAAYSPNASEGKAFFLSSTFPFREEEGEITRFYPAPLLPARETIRIPDAGLTPEQVKLRAREEKNREKLQALLSENHLKYRIGISQDAMEDVPSPVLIERPMTHNRISRLTGSTLSIDESGQLFHMDEHYLKGAHTGLFFLLRGNMECVIPALRFLEHFGIGGDRSTGKGRFQISEPQPFSLGTPLEPNAVMSLSLFKPNPQEIVHWANNSSRLLNYRLEDRQGRKYLDSSYMHDEPLVFFREGSVFPSIQGLEEYGSNAKTGTHQAGFPIHRYGYGFMIQAKIL
ncbi:MAG: hypothetical protein IPN20_03035 [Haliscomenobacter sp.]|nr:hypothetical protein [Haliscomenobacter sp.]